MPDDDLTTIDGVGPAIANELHDAGYHTTTDIQTADTDTLANVHLIGTTTAQAIKTDATNNNPNTTDDIHGGRPSKLDTYKDDILAAARDGLTYEGIARVAGVGISTLHQWRNEYDQFSEALERARAKAERDLIQDASSEFVLERSYSYTKTEEVEVTGDDARSLSAEEKQQLEAALGDGEGGE